MDEKINNFILHKTYVKKFGSKPIQILNENNLKYGFFLFRTIEIIQNKIYFIYVHPTKTPFDEPDFEFIKVYNYYLMKAKIKGCECFVFRQVFDSIESAIKSMPPNYQILYKFNSKICVTTDVNVFCRNVKFTVPNTLNNYFKDELKKSHKFTYLGISKCSYFWYCFVKNDKEYKVAEISHLEENLHDTWKSQIDKLETVTDILLLKNIKRNTFEDFMEYISAIKQFTRNDLVTEYFNGNPATRRMDTIKKYLILRHRFGKWIGRKIFFDLMPEYNIYRGYFGFALGELRHNVVDIKKHKDDYKYLIKESKYGDFINIYILIKDDSLNDIPVVDKNIDYIDGFEEKKYGLHDGWFLYQFNNVRKTLKLFNQ